VLRPTLLFGVPGMFIRLYRKCKVIVSSWWGPRQALFHYAYKRKQRAHRKRIFSPPPQSPHTITNNIYL
jgi:long-subunit acyl-CoA synthetase (AMP-forming)